MISYETIKNILFRFEPETAHHIGEFALKTLPNCRFINSHMVQRNFVDDVRLHQELFGVNFYNPVGLGAGFDKNATMVKAMPALGYGFTEIGTMTPKAQEGNAKPRMFRYPKYKSVQNAMGFNNKGSYVVSSNLKKVYPFSIPVGANIGKNKVTPEDKAIDDYALLIDTFKDICDYLVINISSPNTPNLRDLQNEEFIKALFAMAKDKTDKPILLKIAPDMEADVAIDLCNTAVNSGANGIIATNTTIDYSLLPGAKNFGGLSGEVLREKSYAIFKEIAKELYGKTTLISVGGISTADEAYRRLKAGANLVQSYSGLIFKGPSMCRDINNGIIELMHKDGFENISEVIGADLKA